MSTTSIYRANNVLADEKLKLLHDFLLVERELNEKLAGGLLHTPEIATPTSIWVGRVVGIGEGPVTRKKGVRLPSNLQIGDRVVFDAVASWTTITIDEKKYVLVRELDILGVLAPDVVFEAGCVRANMADSDGGVSGPTSMGEKA